MKKTNHFSDTLLENLAKDLAEVAQCYTGTDNKELTLFAVNNLAGLHPKVEVFARDQHGKEWLLVRVGLAEPVRHQKKLQLQVDWANH